MKQTTLLVLAAMMALVQAKAEERTIDISGNNTSSDYTSYGTAISLPRGDIVNVKMARYCYFSSKITGSGILNLYGGGDRCFLGNSEKKWPDWTGYTGDVHVRHRTLTESGILTLRQTDRRDGDVYNLAGQKVSSDYRGIVIIDGRKVLNK